MNISSFFINRPIFATVVSIIITLIGFMSVRGLAIEQYPQVVPPTVSVTASYPGASAQVLSDTVASVLTEEINGVQDMIYITSTSADSGQLSMQVYFNIGTDPDQATIDVNNRVQRALSQLPTEVQNQGVTVAQRSSSVLMFTALYSPNNEYDRLFLNNYANINILDEIRRLPGVGDAQVLGNQDFAMRIWLNPDKLSQYDLTPAEVASAIQAQNTVVSAGKLNGEPQREPGAYTYTVTTQGRLESADQFRNILLRTNPDGSSLKLSDVARVELGSTSYGIVARVNGSPMAPIAIYQQPGANALDVAAEVKQTLTDMKQRFPSGLDYVIPYDTTLFIDASIESVTHTFIEALLLVAIIVFLFLQNWRSTLVAMSVVPISVVGTFGGMYLLDFSINLLSLFGMILAIGIVVDDAIVVIENIERILEEEPDTTPLNAAFKAMKEVTGPVLATSFIMAAVFVPVAFISGMTGQMYRQFAITIAISVGISALVALSFTPAISAIFIKRHKAEDDPRWLQIVKKPFVWFNRGFDKVTSVFMACVGFLIRHFFLTMAMFAGCCVLSWWLYSQLAEGLIPATDQGVVIASVNMPTGSSVGRTDEYMQKLSAELEKVPGVDYATSIPGFDIVSGAANTAKGTMFLSMKPWSERDITADDLIGTIMQKGAAIPDGQAMAFNLPPIIGLSPTGGLTGYLQSLSGVDADQLYQSALKVMQAANQDPAIAQAFTTLDTSVPTYHIEVDRDKAQSLGVNLDDLNTTLSSTFGSGFVNYFTRQSRNFQVYLQSEDEFRKSPDDLNRVYVRGGDGQRIPLSTLVTMTRQQAPTTLDRYNVYPAAQFQISAAPGYSNGQAIDAVQRIIQDELGNDYSMGWTGEAYQQQNAGNAATIAIVFGIVMVFLILAAQYESWTLPLAVIAAVPFAFLGSVLAVWMRQFDTSVYLQIGLLVVVGLAAKNAILIVEFAQQQRKHEGLSIIEAAKHAALQRFRPIVMTSLAFIGGTLPLAMASGASEASRHHIGTPVVGGMITITILASLFVPATYVFIMQGSEWAGRKLGFGQKKEEAQNSAHASTGRSTHASDDDHS
ncbi:hydrophobic/amphiphilic exporter-1, HAE1 family/multidrug efflux pump [Kushneria avicenniae]|uniref:Efflux pump membrane transporter n=1 Tax=Kushneria avicenniae TaxID=402385 RepID=A0A1I1FBJ4_9GAMM|nr:multidrug efflux RND transporter permease subunit [Kushneria avicenniae]SFB96664.1 hydrophobic/amphiphilic exporter-1, HAE1 family/multidrug efflux pump [Kushneria avicenniae]